MTRPNERMVERLIASDRQLVAQIADAIEARTRPTTTTGSAPQKASVPKKSPEGEKKMIRNKTKTRTTRTRTRKPAPTPEPRVTITAPSDLVREMEEQRGQWPPLPMNPRPILESAHETDVSPCRVCGGEADRLDDRFGPWRVHRECSSLSQEYQRRRAVCRWLSVEVTEIEARVMTLHVPNFADVHRDSTTYTDDDHPAPWDHVDRKGVIRAVMEAKQTLALARTPRRCTLGACALCGVEEGLAWFADGHKRSDGTEAPLCSTCHAVFDSRPVSAQFYDDQRGIVSELLTGVGPQMGEEFPDGLRAHAEVDGGDGSPWSHLSAEAIEAYRLSVWSRQGGKHAPEDRRDEVLAYLARQEAERAARSAAQAASEDIYGFSSDEEVVDDE